MSSWYNYIRQSSSLLIIDYEIYIGGIKRMDGIVKKTITTIFSLLAILLLAACNNQPAYYPKTDVYALTNYIETDLDQDSVPRNLESEDNYALIVDIVTPQSEHEPLEAYELCSYCGAHYVSSLQRQQAPRINIHEIFALWQEADVDFLQEEHDAIVAELEPHTVIYAKLEGVWPVTIALWTDRSFSQVALFTELISVCGYWLRDGDGIDTQQIFNRKEVPLAIDELFTSNVVVLHDDCRYQFITHGAIIFTDAQGKHWRIFMSESDGNYWPLYHIWPQGEIETATDTLPYLDELMSTSPHPLASALRDYMVGNIEVWNTLYGVRISNEVRSAELVTLDDIGTIGVLLEIDDGVMSKVLLHVYNDNLLIIFVATALIKSTGIFIIHTRFQDNFTHIVSGKLILYMFNEFGSNTIPTIRIAYI